MLGLESERSGPEFPLGCVTFKMSSNFSEPQDPLVANGTMGRALPLTPYLSQQQGSNKIKGPQEVGLSVSGTRKQENSGQEEVLSGGLALVPQWGEKSWGREAGWRPEVGQGPGVHLA